MRENSSPMQQLWTELQKPSSTAAPLTLWHCRQRQGVNKNRGDCEEAEKGKDAVIPRQKLVWEVDLPQEQSI